MRKASSNWLGKTIMAAVMGVLIVSFGIWGIADIFKGFGQSTFAEVGGTEISAEQFRQIYTDRLQQLGRQFGRPLTPGAGTRASESTARCCSRPSRKPRWTRKRAAWASTSPMPRCCARSTTIRTSGGLNGQFDPQRFQFGDPPLQLHREAATIAEQRRVGSAAPDRRHHLGRDRAAQIDG